MGLTSWRRGSHDPSQRTYVKGRNSREFRHLLADAVKAIRWALYGVAGVRVEDPERICAGKRTQYEGMIVSHPTTIHLFDYLHIRSPAIARLNRYATGQLISSR
jgi:hypothetical protein